MALSKDIVEASYSNVYTRVEKLPDYVVQRRHPLEPDMEMPDFADVMRQGWRWTFAKMEAAQPKTFSALADCSPVLEYREEFIDSDGERLYWGDLLLRLNDRFMPVFPYVRGDSLESRSGRGESHPFATSLPEKIASAHYDRIAGLGWVNEVPFGHDAYSRVWPHRCDLTTKVAGLLKNERRKNGKLVAENLSPFLTRPQKEPDDVLAAFYVFLDTRPVGNRSDIGELLLAEENSNVRRLIAVSGMRFETARVHENPAEWVDQYTSDLIRHL